MQGSGNQPHKGSVPLTQVDWAPREWFQAQTKDGTDGASSYFGHASNGYQRFRHQALMNALEKFGPQLERHDLIDLGCATGELTALVSRRMGFARAVGVDFVPEVLEAGRALFPEIAFREGALPEASFPDASFDLVIASEVLYYLTPEARDLAVAEIARILRPGGFLLFTAALGPSYFSPEQARTVLEKRFVIAQDVKLRMKLYHTLVSPFYFARRLSTMLRAGSAPASAEARARFERWAGVVRSLPGRMIIEILSRLGGPILASQWLPGVLSRVPVLAGAPTNIIVIARPVPPTPRP